MIKFLAGAGRGGSHFGLIANACVLVAIAAVAATMLLDRATQGPNSALVAFFAPRTPAPAAGTTISRREASAPQFDRLDTTPTASIGRPIVLDPCRGRLK